MIKKPLAPYLVIARPSHWFKNIFMLPGIILAAMWTDVLIIDFIEKLVLGFLGTCLIASANYVINEWLDAEFDGFHPVKKKRLVVIANLKKPFVCLEYILLLLIGLSLSSLVSSYFLITATLFALMGLLYNLKPFRTKDKVYLDVLSESFNNPIRFMLGWFIVTSKLLPPSSLVFGYWMAGAFLMAIKRYAEFRSIGNFKTAGQYRRSFRSYSEQVLLISAFFYAVCAAFFLGVFLVKHRIELLLSLPFISVLFAWYLFIGMKPNSIAQTPEKLYHEKKFIIYLTLLIIMVLLLLVVDIPAMQWFLSNSYLGN